MAERTSTSSRARFNQYREARRRAKSPGTKLDERSHGRSTQRSRTLWSLYRELSRVVSGSWGLVVLAMIIGTLGTMLKLVPPAATKLVVDNVLLGKPLPGWFPSSIPVPGNPRHMLIGLVVAVFVVAVLGSGIGLASRWLGTLVTKRVQVTMRRKVFEHASRLPLHRVYQLKAGGAASLLREDAGGVGELVFSMFYNPWRALVQFLGGLVILAFVDWRMLLCALLLVPAVFLSSRLWNKKLRPQFRDSRAQRQEIDARTAEAFGGMRVVRAFGRQRRESTRFVTGNHVLVRLEVLAWWWSRLIELVWDLVLPAASGTLLLYGGLMVLDGRLTPGDLMMFLVYLAMLLEPVTVIASSLVQLQGNLAGFDRVLDLLAEPREMEGGATGPPRAIRRDDVPGRITLENVSFAYPGTDTQVLTNITLDVSPGETIALVGRSGAGKTTLCNLIARFYDPSSGVVRLDGCDLRSIDVESYRHILGIVEQDVFLFDGTIAENIGYAQRDAPREQIEAAARVANAAEFIESFPDGYETVIGERGVRLSGGQRQRLAIARAVLADARILVLDEATSNLDSESERLIQASLAEVLRNRTSFIIAHRLSTIRHADRIIVLEQGQIVEMGRHEELLAHNGVYRAMVEMQSVNI